MNQPLHHVSNLEFRISRLFRISSFGFRISPNLSGRIMRNEPNLPPNRPPVPQLCETNPISTRPTTQIYEPNPIRVPKNAKRTQFAPTSTPIMRNEPNFTHGGPVEDKKYETNPIATFALRSLGQGSGVWSQENSIGYSLSTIYYFGCFWLTKRVRAGGNDY